jgi:hypothetical protein
MCTQKSPYNWSEQLYARHGQVRIRFSRALGHVAFLLSYRIAHPSHSTDNVRVLDRQGPACAERSARGAITGRVRPARRKPRDYEQMAPEILHVPGKRTSSVLTHAPCFTRSLPFAAPVTLFHRNVGVAPNHTYTNCNLCSFDIGSLPRQISPAPLPRGRRPALLQDDRLRRGQEGHHGGHRGPD